MKTAIIHASKNGFTQNIAIQIQEILEQYEWYGDVLAACETRIEDLQYYRILILGSATYGHGDLENGFLGLEKEMEEHDFTGTFFACFGAGNTRYPRFCEAVDILENRMRNNGSRILLPSLKINTMDRDNSDKTGQWAAFLADRMNRIK